MRRETRIVGAAMAAGLWVALAGVASADDTVIISDFRFAAPTVTIQAGESVTWRNTGAVSHTATGSGFNTGAISPGETASVTFDTAGTFDYVCSFHRNMAGTVIVEGAAAESVPPTDTVAAAPDDASAGGPGFVGAVAILGLASVLGFAASLRRAVPARVRRR